MKILKTGEPGFETAFEALKQRSREESEAVHAQVRAILEDVRRRGDTALVDYTARFDSVNLTGQTLRVPEEECKQAWEKLPPDIQESFIRAKERIERFHDEERSRSWILADSGGEVTGQLVVPLERVGIYVPGGTASYPSSVLMNAIPARVAGVSDIIMVSPPSPAGDTVFTLAAAYLCGVTKVFRIGGAQAVAALAYGTETVPRVDKIVGPGNRFVTAAKKLVYGEVGIDMLAGPSEILIIADHTAHPEFVAADLLSQAEHDKEAQCILITTSEELAEKVRKQIDLQAQQLPRQEILIAAWEKHGGIIISRSLSESVRLANAVASEHLLVAVEDPFSLLGDIKHAGSVFLGHFSPVAAGDYCAGPNHVLPTSGTARFSSPLGVYDFVKVMSVTHLNRVQLEKLGGDIIRIARVEGLEAHARSVEARIRARG